MFANVDLQSIWSQYWKLQQHLIGNGQNGEVSEQVKEEEDAGSEILSRSCSPQSSTDPLSGATVASGEDDGKKELAWSTC
ncbi:hypothetical protein L596_013359 [Steinernema carpocapsae]|uniref:Uncharacterized protein n=1 Tax=Steinernema carpocapsae TaxID=34508 RepID=A0A4U5P0S1_STECR|nr:hypothetical protein L596_013359 [Steinernema carpocapsae]